MFEFMEGWMATQHCVRFNPWMISGLTLNDLATFFVYSVGFTLLYDAKDRVNRALRDFVFCCGMGHMIDVFGVFFPWAKLADVVWGPAIVFTSARFIFLYERSLRDGN